MASIISLSKNGATAYPQFITPALVEDGNGQYSGDKIRVDGGDHKFIFSTLQTLSPAPGQAQAGAVWNNLLFLGYSTSPTVKIYDLTDGTQAGSFTLPNQPHCNTMAFGVETNGTVPYLYISEWDGSRRIFVYSLTQSGGTWSAALVQTINTSSLTSAKAGAGYLDFALDTQAGHLILIAYKIAGQYLKGTANKTCFSVVNRIPAISEGSAVTLANSDVETYFELPCIECRQDGLYNNGKVYLLGGIPNTGDGILGLWVVDLQKQAFVSFIDLTQVSALEPESINIYDGGLIYTAYNTPSLWQFSF